MAGSALFGNLARGAKLLALLLFLLPWVTVSCSPDALNRQAQAAGAPRAPSLDASIPLARQSGLDLAMGNVKLITDGMPQRDNAGAPPDFQPEIGVIAGAALIVLALLATFVLKGGAAAIAGAGGTILAIAALCYSVFFHVPQAARDAFAASGQGSGGTGGPSAAEIAQIIQVKVEAGFYITLLVLVAAVVLNLLAMRNSNAVSASAVPAPPPTEPPAAV